VQADPEAAIFVYDDRYGLHRARASAPDFRRELLRSYCCTNRQIRKRLEEELGRDLTEHKKVIRSHVESFLSGSAAAPSSPPKKLNNEKGASAVIRVWLQYYRVAL
jgi:hypothetical protein